MKGIAAKLHRNPMPAFTPVGQRQASVGNLFFSKFRGI